jgi:hypothetical protein
MRVACAVPLWGRGRWFGGEFRAGRGGGGAQRAAAGRGGQSHACMHAFCAQDCRPVQKAKAKGQGQEEVSHPHSHMPLR